MYEFNKQRDCSGSIIDENYILTAAHYLVHNKHNFTADEFFVRAGSTFSNRGGTVYEVEKFVHHENYYSTPHNEANNDVGLLKLKNPITFDNTKRPIEMFEANERVPADSKGVIVGSGYTQKTDYQGDLQKTEIPVVEQSTCENIYKQSHLEPGYFCAGYLEQGGKDTCRGDSGGPFVIDGRLAGIVSWGATCGIPGYPGVYANVAYFRDWIDEHMG